MTAFISMLRLQHRLNHPTREPGKSYPLGRIAHIALMMPTARMAQAFYAAHKGWDK